MRRCPYCGQYILTNFNQHLAIQHPEKWNAIKQKWVQLKMEGMTIRDIAERFNTSTTTVSKAINESMGSLSSLAKRKENVTVSE